MPAFDPAEPTPPFDFVLMQNGSVNLYWDLAVLDDACTRLSALGYRVVRIEADAWCDAASMFDALAVALDFPDYSGRNFDALNDCLSDVAAGDFGAPADATGLALVLTGYDSFAAADPVAAQTLAGCFADQSRTALLFGRRLVCLLQSGDPRFALAPVGARAASWNPAEWSDSQREV
ncbi:barstar family protein [Isoptericola halotolerans]|uniref:barstar family protein n=1 Tax=Isoptericola halotolerans TaxID=300560 RepID=UPI00388F4A83